MKTNRLLGLVLTSFAAAAMLQQASAQPYTLTGSSYTNNFDDLQAAGSSFEPGWYLYTGATSTSPGGLGTWNSASYLAISNTWQTTTGKFGNQAGGYSYIGGTNFTGAESKAIQTNELNRCLAIRQTGSLGDPGGAFVFKISDTANRKDFSLALDFLNLDPTSPRTTTWTVDYGIGSSPSAFTPVATYVNTALSFHSYHTNITFPNGTIDNIDAGDGPVWIRVVALSASSGSGARETTAIDNFGLTWAAGSVCAPVSITANPAPMTAYPNGNASFTVGALGTAPRTYQWLKNGSPLSDDGHFANTATPSLSISTVTAADAGTYSCTVANNCNGTDYSVTSTGAKLTVSTPPAVSINYLHTLVDSTSYAPTNTSALWTATGIITTTTNTTSANTASYYLQDGTGGINLFCTFGSTFRPSLGDEVTVVGFLNGFQGNLEIEADLSNPAQSVNVLSNNIANYPVAKVVAWDNLYQGGTNGPINYGPLGSIVLLTNVYFGTNAGVVTYSTNNLTAVVTNASGKIARVFLASTQVNDLTNRTIPSFAYAVQGPLVATAAGYEISPTSWADILISPLTIGVAHSGSTSTITWTAVPLTYSYTVLGATTVAGPYTVLATGLKFTDANGTYTDTGASGSYKFYRVTSP